MGQRQADALASLEVATNDRLNAISVATQQGIINLYQVRRGCAMVLSGGRRGLGGVEEGFQG